jgi:IS30 family transposase
MAVNNRRYIKFEDRKKIEQYLNRGVSIPSIADYLNFSKSSIYREVKRCGEGNYSADDAQKSILGG